MNVEDLRRTMPNFEIYRGWQRLEGDQVEGILIHHSGSGSVDGSGRPNLSLQAMADYHVQREGRAHVSYHYAIGLDGTIFYLLDESIPGYHAFLPEPSRANRASWQRWHEQWLNGQYFNRRTLAILVLGWFDLNRVVQGRTLPNEHNQPSDAQWRALVELVRQLKERYNLSVQRVEGHREALARAGFGSTSCPGSQFDMSRLRAALSGAAPRPTGPIVVPGPPPPLTFARNRPLVGLHARNDHLFTPTDWAIIRQAKIESLKMMSFTRDEVYAQARQINPKMEFIVRLYAGSPGRGNMPSPQAFADMFRERIEQLHGQFQILKFELHNEPNHLTGLEGWGQERADALAFQGWYKELFAILRARHPWALLGYPGLAVPHKDLEWLEWNREAIEMSDFLGCHAYWQTPPDQPNNFQSEFWALRFKRYHEKYPHKLIEITEWGNSNGQSPPLTLTREEQRRQYQWWLQHILAYPYLGSAHSFIATSPDPTWRNQGFTWGDEGGPFPVAAAVGAISRPPRRPDWYYLFTAKLPEQLPPGAEVTFPVALGNGGRLPWIRAGRARTFVNAKWFDPADKQVGPATSLLLPHDMAPGDQASFSMTMRAPAEPGRYRLRLALFHNGQEQWLHLLDSATAPDFFAVTVGEPPPRRPPELAAAYSLPPLPERLLAGEWISLLVTVRNQGARGWQSRGNEQGSIRLGYHWIDARGRVTEGATRGQLPAAVPRGGTAQVNLSLQLPLEPGTYTLRVALVSEFEQWFPQNIERKVVVEAGTYGARYRASLPNRVSVGEQLELPLHLTNSGNRSWRANGSRPITVSHLWLTEEGRSVGGTLRTLLPRDVQPGESVTVALPLLAPAEPGNYRVRIDLVEEGKFFFSQRGIAPFMGGVTVAPAERVPEWAVQWLEVGEPTSRVAGRPGRLDVRLRNSGRQPWGRASIRVAYRWDEGPPSRVALPTDVAPGSEIALGLPLRPPAPGTLTLFLGLWREGEGWLDLPGPSRQVQVVPPDAPERAIPGGGQEAVRPFSEPRADDERARPLNPAAAGATASHNPEAARLALDDDPSTCWSSGERQAAGMWFRLDLGERRELLALHLVSQPEEYPRGYLLEGSLDGEQWERLDSESANWSDLRLSLPEARPLRYLRITLTNESAWHPWSICRIEVETEP